MERVIMADKPSFMSSTFSIITLIVVVGMVGLCVFLKDVSNLKELAMVLLGGYGFKKAYEMNNDSNKPK